MDREGKQLSTSERPAETTYRPGETTYRPGENTYQRPLLPPTENNYRPGEGSYRSGYLVLFRGQTCFSPSRKHALRTSSQLQFLTFKHKFIFPSSLVTGKIFTRTVSQRVYQILVHRRATRVWFLLIVIDNRRRISIKREKAAINRETPIEWGIGTTVNVSVSGNGNGKRNCCVNSKFRTGS